MSKLCIFIALLLISVQLFAQTKKIDEVITQADTLILKLNSITQKVNKSSFPGLKTMVKKLSGNINNLIHPNGQDAIIETETKTYLENFKKLNLAFESIIDNSKITTDTLDKLAAYNKNIFRFSMLQYQNNLIALKQFLTTLKLQKQFKRSIDSILTTLEKYADTNFIKLEIASIKKDLSKEIININLPSIADTTFYNYVDTYIVQPIKNKIDNAFKEYSKKCCSKNEDSANKAYNIAGTNGFSNSVYSIYYYRVLKSGNNNLSWILGSEIAFPIQSKTITHAGLFLSTGMYQNKFLFQLGLAWLNTDVQNDISWKCGLNYYPDKSFGLGISYSPITSFGAGISFKF